MLYQLGILYLHDKKPEKAIHFLKYLLHSLEQNDVTVDKVSRENVLLLLGEAYMSVNRWFEAVHTLETCKGCQLPTIARLKADNLLGLCYLSLENVDSALICFQESRVIIDTYHKAEIDPRTKVVVYSNLGNLLMQKEDHVSAIDCFRKLLEVHGRYILNPELG
jgi:tetratricopeptide (TPR) repeat protein